MSWENSLGLLAIILAIGAAIYYLEIHKPGRVVTPESGEIQSSLVPAAARKEQKYSRVKEIVSPSGFINTAPLRLADLVGKQVIMVDFWTYSCINCQRTLPYLNAWHEKYSDQGLTIVGVHTPEFDFEKERANVEAAVKKYQIKYPVVQDNDYATWRAYRNRYWPRKYLIDIDGFIVYDHIGEGAYAETEKKIQELLAERQVRLGQSELLNTSLASVEPATSATRSPEVHFGSARNELLGNGKTQQTGRQKFVLPTTILPNTLYLEGEWDIQPEYAQNTSVNAKVVFRYEAATVNVVAQAATPQELMVRRDGQSTVGVLGREARDVGGEGIVTLKAAGLYQVIHDPNGARQHTIELTIPEPGVQFFTFTFG